MYFGKNITKVMGIEMTPLFLLASFAVMVLGESIEINKNSEFQNEPEKQTGQQHETTVQTLDALEQNYHIKNQLEGDTLNKFKMEEDVKLDVQLKECVVSFSNNLAILNCSRVLHANIMQNTVDIDVLDLSQSGLRDLNEVGQNPRLRKLTVLNASNNDIQNLPEHMFDDFKYLEKIDLSHNKIQQLADGVFVQLENLKYLDLSNNKLISLPSALPMTDWFDISNNLISSLPETYSNVLFPQTVFLLGGNPFNCTCDILWLKELLDTRMYLLKFVPHLNRERFIPACTAPVELRGQSWEMLDDHDFKCEVSSKNYAQSHSHEDFKKFPSSDFKVTVSDIGPTWLVVQWTKGIHDENAIEIKLHKFGESKNAKSVILPMSATNYRWKHLVESTPYIICFTVSDKLVNHLIGCEEVETLKVEKAENVFVQFVLDVILGYFKHLIFVVLMTVVACFVVWKTDNKEKKS